MPVPITPATRLAITTLRGEGLTYDQIAARVGVHYDTVRRTLVRETGQRLKKLEAELATRETILRRMSYILQHAEEYKDSIAAAKLIAMMEGWLSPSTPDVNINVLGGSVDLKQLESEYAALRAKALESPSALSSSAGEAQVSTNTLDAIVGQPGASEANSSPLGDSMGGGIPPGADGNGI